MPPRAWDWSKRIFHGSGRVVPLDFGTELWEWDASLYESADGIVASSARANRKLDSDEIAFEATRSLLPDVVDAAGGVESAFMRLQDAMDRAQAAYIRFSSQTGGPLPDGGGLVDPSVEDAWYSLEELLVWARTLDDRLRRPALDKRRYPDQGLIPALADGPRRDAAIRARARLLGAGVAEARFLTGLSLHMQSMHAGSKGGLVRSGEIVLRFPDRVKEAVGHRWQLPYDDDRDGVAFANALMVGVERFMDELIAAFENHVPDRFKVSVGVEAAHE